LAHCDVRLQRARPNWGEPSFTASPRRGRLDRRGRSRRTPPSPARRGHPLGHGPCGRRTGAVRACAHSRRADPDGAHRLPVRRAAVLSRGSVRPPLDVHGRSPTSPPRSGVVRPSSCSQLLPVHLPTTAQGRHPVLPNWGVVPSDHTTSTRAVRRCRERTRTKSGRYPRSQWR
jgi:hypothetical protein